ncbi:unnamed protein product, partial [Rotaria magnacalcarata]
MKHSSSGIHPQSSNNDDKLYQASDSKMVRRLSPQFERDYEEKTIILNKQQHRIHIKAFISDTQLAENALINIQQKGGDILLLRKEPNNDSLFIQTIREHQSYRKFFSEEYKLFGI